MPWASPNLWGVFLVLVILIFTVLEVSGVWFGAPWGACTDFIRGNEQHVVILRWALAVMLPLGVLHLVGGWP